MDTTDFEETIDSGGSDFSLDLEQKDQGKCPYLLVMTGKNSGNMFRLNLKKNPVTLGRTDNCDIELDQRDISRKHAKIYEDQNQKIFIQDLDSTNGTFVNGEEISKKQLSDGDKIHIGKKVVVRFSYQDRLDEKFFQKVFKSAKTDGLTGVLNKSSFKNRFRPEFNYCRKRELNLSILFLDIDHFKSINDTYGHEAGDYVLKKLAQTISDNIRNEDLLARYGGEEFVLVQRQTNTVKAFRFAERIRTLIDDTSFKYEDKSLNITVSIGIATLENANFSDALSMLKEADSYLYKAKENGRNCVESVFNKEK